MFLLDIFIFVVLFLYAIFVIGWFIYIYYDDIDKLLQPRTKQQPKVDSYKPDLSKLRRPVK